MYQLDSQGLIDTIDPVIRYRCSTYCLLIVRLQVRVLPGSPNRIHLEPLSLPVEQFLTMLRFEQRDKLAELSIDFIESGRDDFT
jgi:hypothetical protein